MKWIMWSTNERMKKDLCLLKETLGLTSHILGPHWVVLMLHPWFQGLVAMKCIIYETWNVCYVNLYVSDVWHIHGMTFILGNGQSQEIWPSRKIVD